MGVRGNFSTLGLIGKAAARKEVEAWAEVEVRPNCVDYTKYNSMVYMPRLLKLRV